MQTATYLLCLHMRRGEKAGIELQGALWFYKGTNPIMGASPSRSHLAQSPPQGNTSQYHHGLGLQGMDLGGYNVTHSCLSCVWLLSFDITFMGIVPRIPAPPLPICHGIPW